MRLGIVKDAIGGKSQDASVLLDATNAVLSKREMQTAGDEERQQIDQQVRLTHRWHAPDGKSSSERR
eukprot:6190323-Pleurochrysis_carterae.AAC.1